MDTYVDKLNPILSKQFVAEVQYNYNRKPKKLFTGTLVILNDGIIEYLGFAKVYENTTTNYVKVDKNHTIAIGQRLDTGQGVVNIDYSNENYDILELETNITLSAGDIILTDASRDGSVGFIADDYEDIETGQTVKVALNCVIDLKKMVIDLSSQCDEIQTLAINSAFLS